MRFVALAAAVASLTLCPGLELTSRQKIEQRNALVEQKRRELQPMAFEVPIDTLRRTRAGNERHVASKRSAGNLAGAPLRIRRCSSRASKRIGR